MSNNTTRTEVFIDVLHLRGQHAQVLDAISPMELVEAVLQEFRSELEYLGDTADGYRLVRSDDHTPLDEATPIGKQLQSGDHLTFEERDVPLPLGARQLSKPVYVRDEAGGKVFRLTWQPAIIGRPDPSLEGNELLAINLEAERAGPRVSRRHAQIVEESDQFFIESLSQNATVVRDATGAESPVAGKRTRLNSGDVIYLKSSKIALKFIVRPEDSAHGG